MPSLAEGVARMLEKFVEAAYAREVDEMKLTTAAPPPTERVVTMSPALPQEDRAVVERLFRQEVSRVAFRKVYRERLQQSRETLARLEPRVAEDLARMGQPQVTIGVRGRQGVQITIGSKEGIAGAGARGQEGREQHQRQQQAPGREQAEPPVVPLLSARAPPVTKGVMRAALIQATSVGMQQLGVDAAQPFRASLAAQAASHPQLRALVVAALPEAIEASRHAAEGRRRRGGHEAAGAGAAATTTPPPPTTPATMLGRVSAPRRPASALVVKIKAGK